jgi:hypothetical protein
MKNIKDELQNIILGDGPIGSSSKLKQVQNFLRGNARPSEGIEKQEYFKGEEEKCLIDFATQHSLFYSDEIDERMFISEGAEQRVYKFDDLNVIKLNSSIFYEYWLDYFNSLLIHNFFFSSTNYEFLAFKIIDEQLYALVKQKFVIANQTTDLQSVRSFLEYNSFHNTRNNDYISDDLGLIFEDLHDENVLTKDGILYFIDTVFYISKDFF